MVRSYPRGMVRLSRRPGWRDNALRRPVDRLESRSVFAAMLLVVASVPLALGFGFAVYQTSMTASARQLSADRYVTATLLDDATARSVAEGMHLTVPVRAQWSGPVGVRHTGRVSAPNSANAGTSIPVLVDAYGAAVQPPLTGGEALERGVVAALAVIGGFAVVLSALVGVLRWRLDQHRYAVWAAEWRAVSPQWTEQSG
jgi:hypothetical protein